MNVLLYIDIVHRTTLNNNSDKIRKNIFIKYPTKYPFPYAIPNESFHVK